MLFDFKGALNGKKEELEIKEATHVLENMMNELKKHGIPNYQNGDRVRFLFTLSKRNQKNKIDIFYSLNYEKLERLITDIGYDDNNLTERIFYFLNKLLYLDGYIVYDNPIKEISSFSITIT